MLQTEYDYFFQVKIIGPSRVGKTSILARFMDEGFDQDVPQTIEDNLKIKTLKVDHSICKVQILDTAPNKTTSNNLYQNAQVIILVFDITNRSSIDLLRNDFREQTSRSLQNGKIVYALVGNKFDLNEAHQISQNDCLILAREFNCPYAEVSSKNNSGIKELFDLLISEAKFAFIREQANKNTLSINLIRDLAPQKGSRCF